MNPKQTRILVFGIPNCDTVKQARTWLEAYRYPFEFHNFKKEELSQEQIQIWLQKITLNELINRKGTTWRALSEIQQAQLNTIEGALQLLPAHSSVIKRPVLQIENEGLLHVGTGFSADQYQSILSQYCPH